MLDADIEIEEWTKLSERSKKRRIENCIQMNARLSKNPKFFGSKKDEWLKEAFVMETIVPKTSPVGRKRKKLGDESIGRTTRNKIVDSIVNDIEEFAKKEGVSNNELY